MSDLLRSQRGARLPFHYFRQFGGSRLPFFFAARFKPSDPQPPTQHIHQVAAIAQDHRGDLDDVLSGDFDDHQERLLPVSGSVEQLAQNAIMSVARTIKVA
ncbi:hypothetical protein HX882_32055 [Pseudomonas gingeri]|uniref:Uncharacterized protein n=1 Tax=Pseudomonas gingeri TaxID=117681 RepID=A0A7Y7XII1_9PSED|nr:hypothetical protein [Pseudomonas gingeri]NWA29235.1 hypothetical protein [Pseudomonas gingeri]NWC00515.1 hypothetical protein [Pseudomonas gingeri]